MSAYETKSASVVREGAPAPFYEPTLLPVPPRKLDCIGEECPFAQKEEGCYSTRHHLFYEHAAYLALGYPYDELVNDPHAIKGGMAICRHNSGVPAAWHNRYTYTRLPREEVAVRFLDESRTLQRLSVLIATMSTDINSIYSDRPQARWEVFGEGTYQQKLERYEKHALEYKGLLSDIGEIEVMPTAIVGNVVTQLGRQRNELASRAAQVPELACVMVPRMLRLAGV